MHGNNLTSLLLVLFFSCLVLCEISEPNGSIGGDVSVIITNSDQLQAIVNTNQQIELKISIFKLDVVTSNNSTYPYVPGLVEITTQIPVSSKINTLSISPNSFPQQVKSSFRFDNLPINSFYIVIGQVVSGSSRTSFNGWYRQYDSGYFSPIELTNQKNSFDASFVVEGITPYPKEKQHNNGHFRYVKGLPVLSLHGDEKEKGYAHGLLMAQHILDFFRFYVLEGFIESAQNYLNIHVPIMNSNAFSYDKEFMEAIEGVYSGMLDSGINLFVTELKRKFLPVDLIAINAYIELEYVTSHGVPNIPSMDQSLLSKLNKLSKQTKRRSDKPHVACTQFAVWGQFTSKNCPNNQNANLISARNMDGEVDMRRVTVHSILITSVTPRNPSHKKYISVMWPGFVGTLSAVNEDGVYAMMNYGVNQPNTTWSQGTIMSWVFRDIMLYTSANTATPKNVQDLIETRRSKTGGVCLTGCILFITRRNYNISLSTSPAMVYEADWRSGMMRLPGQAFPRTAMEALGASNHNHLYGVESGDRSATFNFGSRNGFSSEWRYQVGANLIDLWYRTSSINSYECNSQMREILKRAAGGFTEHSIIFRPLNNGRIEIDIAVAEPSFTGWDASNMQYTTFDFQELF